MLALFFVRKPLPPTLSPPVYTFVLSPQTLSPFCSYTENYCEEQLDVWKRCNPHSWMVYELKEMRVRAFFQSRTDRIMEAQARAASAREDAVETLALDSAVTASTSSLTVCI